MKSDGTVWLVTGSRTPIGTFGKSLRNVAADKLAAHAIAHTIRRAGITPGAVEGIYFGHGYQNSYMPNTGRYAWVNVLGYPATTPAATVQRQCGSGMEAATLAGNQIRLGNADLMLCGGVESMTTIPYMLPSKLRFTRFVKLLSKYTPFRNRGPRPIFFALADDGLAPTKLLWDMKSIYMSGTAQRLADMYEIPRKDADEFALRSQELAAQAIKSGRFDLEIDPIEVPGRGFFTKDEHPRKTSLDELALLKPVLRTRDITAGNSSGINDGACALLLASSAKMVELGSAPLAKLVDSCVAGVDPEQMGIGPVAAITQLLERNKLNLADIDLIEVNEAFAAQYLAVEKLLKLDRNKVNVNGGAIALGHPIGMSGARLILTLAHELKARGLKRGIASLCIGGGMGIATLIERP
jgi:acetyl-CoA C-acetyltransferase